MASKYGGIPVNQETKSKYGGIPVSVGEPVGESIMESAAGEVRKIPGAKFVQELAAAANRGVANIADTLIVDPIQATQGMMGFEPMPDLVDMPFAKPFIEGGQMDDGLAKRVVRAGGEAMGPGGLVGGVTRAAAKALPEATGAMGAVVGSLRQMGAGSASTDVISSGLAGAGATAGEDAGGVGGSIVGGVLAPMAGMPAGAMAAMLAKKGLQSLNPLE